MSTSPPALHEITKTVTLTTEQIAKMCGVSRRQLSYWIERGIIADEQVHRPETIEKVVLIKREIDSGRKLRQAVRRAERQLAERHHLMSFSQTDSAAPLLTRLNTIERSIGRLRESIHQQTSIQALVRLSIEIEALDLTRSLADTSLPQAELGRRLGRAAYLLQRLTN